MNGLLTLPAELLFFNLLGVGVCLIIMFACVCRLNVLEPRRWRLSLEQVMLLAYVAWAAGTMFDLLRGELIGFHGAAAGLGIMIYLLVSFRQWELQQALLHEAKDREARRAQRELHSCEEDAHVHSINR